MPKTKEPIILVNATEGHNKFWIAEHDPNDPTIMLVRNGRLGTKGERQEPKKFSSEYGAERAIDSKMHEKYRKGYRTVNKREFDLLNLRAAAVGVNNKCGRIEWIVARHRNTPWTGSSLEHEPAGDRIQEPDYEPLLLVEIETKKYYPVDALNRPSATYTKNSFSLLFTGDDCKVGTRYSHDKVVHINDITVSHPLWELVIKIKDSIGAFFF